METYIGSNLQWILFILSTALGVATTIGFIFLERVEMLKNRVILAALGIVSVVLYGVAAWAAALLFNQKWDLFIYIGVFLGICFVICSVLKMPSQQNKVVRKKLKSFVANIEGIQVDAATILYHLWDEFESGITDSNFITSVIKHSELKIRNPNKAFPIIQSVLKYLSRYKVIQQEQRKETNPRGSFDVSYWKLTDFGRGVIQDLEQTNKGGK